MKPLIVLLDSIQQPIQPSPGFAKKHLSDYKLDACGLCQFGCAYCSSNGGNYLRINRKEFLRHTEEQLGQRILPKDEPRLMFVWKDYADRLRNQLDSHSPTWGKGYTLVYSMLTDGFSPYLVKAELTEQTLRWVIERTQFRIRILTKNRIVGTPKWIRFFKEYSDRFIVGLSTGTLDHSWARQVEKLTSSPSSRTDALRSLQDAGIPTYGMLCPVFPDLLEEGRLERLVDSIRPDLCEHVWAEPYNDRDNWECVRDGYASGSAGYNWLEQVYGQRHKDLWSRYATDLYIRLSDKAAREGWLHKLRYLLYEKDITAEDARRLSKHQFASILLQSKANSDGTSTNPYVACYMKAIRESSMPVAVVANCRERDQEELSV